MSGEKIKVFNFGNHRRDFTYVDDIVEGVVRVADHVPASNLAWSGDQPGPQPVVPTELWTSRTSLLGEGLLQDSRITLNLGAEGFDGVAGCNNYGGEYGAADGGILCGKCGRNWIGATEVSVNALKVLRFLQTRGWETCRLLRLNPSTRAEIERVMNAYITYHLERKLKSVDFIHRLRRQMGAG